jgi:hypothetical protein
LVKIIYAFLRKIQTLSLGQLLQISRSNAIFRSNSDQKIAPGFARRFFYSLNAHVLARKNLGVAFAFFAKGMTTYFCRSGTVC